MGRRASSGWAAGIVLAGASVVQAGGALDTRIPGPSYLFEGNVAIADNNANGSLIFLPISGVDYPIADATISITMSHTWVGDLEATLISPGGLARLKLFGRAGYRKSGDSGISANLSGTYTFDDFAPTAFWSAISGLGTTSPVAPGTYRTATASKMIEGSLLPKSSSGGCSTYLSGAFGGLTPAQAEGTWTLVIADRASSDTGSVTAVELTLNYPETIFASGFESYGGTAPFAVAAFESLGTNQAPITGSPPRGSCTPAQFDLDGDGLTDYALLRDDSGNIRWYVKENDLAATGAEANFLFGSSSTDFVLADDFDGDGIDDPMTWTLADDGVFRIRRSSRPDDEPVEIHFGSSTGFDVDPTQAGDFDGDGVADPAFLRTKLFNSGDGPAIFKSLLSAQASRVVRTIDTGLVGDAADFFAIGGLDTTGDRIADVPIQTAKLGDPTLARWYVFNGYFGTLAAEFDFELSSDFILPGNHVGNFQADITLRRTVSSQRHHFFRDGQTGATSGPTIFGIINDTSAPGDYDGDGIDDLAVWRSSSTPGLSKFLVRRSTSPDPALEVPMGQLSDFPLASSRVH